MRKFLLLALVAATVGTASATAQSYSGTWSLDPKRSVLEDGVDPVSLTGVVLDTAVTIRVTVRRPDSEHSYSLRFDGTPGVETVGSDRYTRTVERDQGALVFRTQFVRGFDKGTVAYRERWTLSNDGRTLSIYTTFPGGRDLLRVFARKDQP